MAGGVGETMRRLRACRAEIDAAILALTEMTVERSSPLDEHDGNGTHAHVRELVASARPHEHRRVELVGRLLAGEQPAAASELDYELDGEHIAVILSGAGAEQAVRELARRADRRLLCVTQEDQTVWAWLGGRYSLEMSVLTRLLAAPWLGEAQPTVALGEPGQGPRGWRLTHRQARAALAVAQRRGAGSPRTTRYGEVALLAAALKDEMVAGALTATYLLPLEDDRGGGRVLRETLRAYLAAEHNVSSAAATLGVVRNTVKNRLRTIEAILERSLRPCPAELEVALALDELGESCSQEISAVR